MAVMCTKPQLKLVIDAWYCLQHMALFATNMAAESMTSSGSKHAPAPPLLT